MASMMASLASYRPTLLQSRRMTLFLVIVLLAVGIGLLVFGARLLIDHALALAKSWGVAIIAIGFTVVAVGTSLPELLVGIIAGWQGQGDLVVGNILGSNLANIGLILGLALLIRPAVLPARNHALESYSLVVSSVLLFLLLLDGRLSRLDGLLLTLLGIGFLWLALRRGREEHRLVQTVEKATAALRPRRRAAHVVGILAGIALLYFGARLTVDNAVTLATLAGLSQAVIGLTIIAIGTSLPELFTSVIASWRREGDLAIGNALGSNIMNILLVLGLTALVAPIRTSFGLWRHDLITLIVVTAVVAALLRYARHLGRVWGAVLSGSYLIFAVFAYLR